MFIYTPNLAPQYPIKEFLLHPPFSFISERASLHISLVHQVSAGLSASSPTEARQGRPLLHMSQGHQTSPCMLFGWRLSPWELSGIQVSCHCLSFCGVAISFSAFNTPPNSSIGVPNLNLMVGHSCICLSQLLIESLRGLPC